MLLIILIFPFFLNLCNVHNITNTHFASVGSQTVFRSVSDFSQSICWLLLEPGNIHHLLIRHGALGKPPHTDGIGLVHFAQVRG